MESVSMEVRVVTEQEVNNPKVSDYVRVCTSADPNDDTVTLATIQRITENLVTSTTSDAPIRVKTLISEQPMSPDLALGLATLYAERKHIPIVCTDSNLYGNIDKATAR